MLLELAQWLAKDFRAFNVFGYITLRAVLATMTALAISFAFGPAVIRWLTAKKIGQSVRTTDRRRTWSRPARRPWAAR
jgi:phospho-N-acetylmuramoyl-pentapeptide-transferase